jgi:hypothetical protein
MAALRVQLGCALTAEVVVADRPDSPPCPVAITDRGNGTHELSFMSTVVRQPFLTCTVTRIACWVPGSVLMRVLFRKGTNADLQRPFAVPSC